MRKILLALALLVPAVAGATDVTFRGGGTPGVCTQGSGVQSVQCDGLNNIASDIWTTVSGGADNQTTATEGTISGGVNNRVTGAASVVGGGQFNINSANHGAIGGGNSNSCSGDEATISGGNQNGASGNFSGVGGGRFNTASGPDAFIAGGSSNSASGDHSFAAGFLSSATSPGSFVWADVSTGTGFVDNGPNTFNIRAANGVYFSSTTVYASTFDAVGSAYQVDEVTVIDHNRNFMGHTITADTATFNEVDYVPQAVAPPAMLGVTYFDAVTDTLYISTDGVGFAAVSTGTGGGGTTTPVGPEGAVQINVGGAFFGDATLTQDATNHLLTVAESMGVGDVTSTGVVAAVGFNGGADPYNLVGYATYTMPPPSGVAATDTANIHTAMNAVAAGGTIIFREGTYLISAFINNATSGMKWIGQGNNVTFLKADDGLAATQRVLSLTGANNTIEEMTLNADGDIRAGGAGGSAASDFVFGTQVFLKNVNITNSNSVQIFVQVGNNSDIENVQFGMGAITHNCPKPIIGTGSLRMRDSILDLEGTGGGAGTTNAITFLGGYFLNNTITDNSSGNWTRGLFVNTNTNPSLILNNRFPFTGSGGVFTDVIKVLNSSNTVMGNLSGDQTLGGISLGFNSTAFGNVGFSTTTGGVSVNVDTLGNLDIQNNRTANLLSNTAATFAGNVTAPQFVGDCSSCTAVGHYGNFTGFSFTLGAGTTFQAYVPSQGIVLSTISVTVVVAGIGGAGDTYSCDDGAGNSLSVTVPAATAAGVTTSATGSATVPLGNTVSMSLATSSAVTTPVVNVLCEYLFQ